MRRIGDYFEENKANLGGLDQVVEHLRKLQKTSNKTKETITGVYRYTTYLHNSTNNNMCVHVQYLHNYTNNNKCLQVQYLHNYTNNNKYVQVQYLHT